VLCFHPVTILPRVKTVRARVQRHGGPQAKFPGDVPSPVVMNVCNFAKASPGAAVLRRTRARSFMNSAMRLHQMRRT